MKQDWCFFFYVFEMYKPYKWGFLLEKEEKGGKNGRKQEKNRHLFIGGLTSNCMLFYFLGILVSLKYDMIYIFKRFKFV